MLLRARFFDDWRLSRIDEEAERLSVNSDTSVAVETSSSPLRATQRCASAEGVAPSDDDEPPLPPPPSPLPPTTKEKELDVEQLQRLDEETEALRFLQVKYDTLGKVKVDKPQNSAFRQPTTTTSGADDTVAVGPRSRLPRNYSSTSTNDERPIMTVDSSDRPQSSVPSHGSVCDRRRPPPLPSTDCGECRCTASNETGSNVDRLQAVVDDCRYHDHRRHYHSQQQQPEQLAHHQQRCVQKSVCQQSQHHRHSVNGGGRSVVFSCDGDRPRRAGGAAGRHCCSLLSNAELFQIDLFYRSRKTLVHVCPCPALLYFARAGAASSSSWRFAAAGVPVIVADTLRLVVGPRLHVVLAERGTGFELWRYGLTGAQQYVVGEDDRDGGGAAFHTLSLPSGDVAGLCFDDDASADEFHRQLLKLDDLYSTGGTGSRNRKGKKTAKCRERSSGAHQ